MGLTVLVAVVTILAVVESGRIRRESADCEKITVAHGECVKEAYESYKAIHGAGDDGRGDWEARKSCNFVNSAVGECGDMLTDCYGEDEVNAMKDHQVESILKQLERRVGGWDSSKCPVVSEYLERQAGDEDDAEEGDAEVGDAEEGDAEEGDAEDGDAEEGDAEEGDAEEGEAEEGDAEEGDAEEGDAEEGDTEEGDAEEGDAEEGVAEEGDAEEGDAEKGDAEEGAEEEGDEGDESEDGGEGDNEDEDDAEEGDDESSGPILISSFTMVLACLLAA